MKLLRRYVKQSLNELFGDGFSMSGARRFDAPGNVRYDVMTSPSKNSSGEFDREIDDEYEAQNENRAACCLIRRSDGKILAVSRERGKDKWGLPGGHVEQNEKFEDAAVRELKEETGLVADTCSLIHDGFNDNGFHVKTYACKCHGQIKSSDEGDCAWVTEDVLSDPLRSPFADFFVEMFRSLV